MKIQLIRYSNEPSYHDGGIFISSLGSPRALDDFDFNIIDLSIPEMWKYDESYVGNVNCSPDLKTLFQMVNNMKNACVLYVFPQNCIYTYNAKYHQSRKTERMKDVIDHVVDKAINKVVYYNHKIGQIFFEKTSTTVGGKRYEADFYMNVYEGVITKSDFSEKPTTIMLSERIYATTLNVTERVADLLYYIKEIFEPDEKSPVPEWMNEIKFADDNEQHGLIEQSIAEIEAAKNRIADAERKLADNAKFKSILYTNGDELVSVVFEVLEAIFQYDLSEFEDVKDADFLIQLPKVTFIGEIKGIGSNVRNENISQLEHHYQKYIDKLNEEKRTETVKQILIINPFRNKAVNQREPINDSQIDLAKHYGSLIVETNTLLRVFEKFCSGEVVSEKCIEVFRTKTGLLTLDDFE